MKDSQKVMRVVQAYNLFVQAVTGNKFIKVISPKSFGKSWLNCIEVYNACDGRKMPLYEYFVVAHLQYSLDWVKKIFQGRAYLPLSIVVSEKSIRYVMGSYLYKLKERPLDRVLRYKTILRNDGYADVAIDLILKELGGC